MTRPARTVRRPCAKILGVKILGAGPLRVISGAVPAVVVALVSLLADPAPAQNRDQVQTAQANSQNAASAGQRPPPPGRTGLPLPRFVSLRAAEVNLRAGPGTRYPIDWVYRRSGMPVEIIDEFDTWRRIRDWQGTEGWIHQSMVQGRRGVLITGQLRTLRRKPEAEAPGVAQLEAGVVGTLEGCRGEWCEVAAGGYSGWLPRNTFYGLYPGEEMK